MTADERAQRFGFLLSEIEQLACALLDGRADDIVGVVTLMSMHIEEAKSIAYEVSREALDKVVGPTTIKLKEPLPADTEIKDVLPP